jgi:NADH dehydrogenase [ubiquinone] 1 alpha subcomplex assembly factor 7
MSEQVAAAIREAIQDHGPIAFGEFMDIALYGPGGYYERPPVGAHGDFVTSPHVHPVFATMVARALRDFHAGLGEPRPFRITEVGAGDGTLARQLLRELSELDVDYTAVEASTGARAALEVIDGVCVEAEFGGGAHVVLANELLDNLPFDRSRGGREIRIALDGDRFVEVESSGGSSEDAEMVEPVAAFAFIDRLATMLNPGYALLIDYGAVGATGGDVHGYRDHRVVEDLLIDPGSTDITVGVDFERIARRAEKQGLLAFPSVTQHDALRALGFEDWIREELDRQVELLDARDGLGAVHTWSGRSRATLLVDPIALGRIRWLVLATQGLPRLEWLP